MSEVQVKVESWNHADSYSLWLIDGINLKTNG